VDSLSARAVGARYTIQFWGERDPTGRFFGRITQKGLSKNVSGRTNLRQNFSRNFPEMAEKGLNIDNVLFPVFFPYET
jgi:hypothetical protein